MISVLLNRPVFCTQKKRALAHEFENTPEKEGIVGETSPL